MTSIFSKNTLVYHLKNLLNFTFLGSFAFFLGAYSLKNPPLFILSEDRSSFSLIINEESDLDYETKTLFSEKGPIKGILNIKIKKVFRTPLRNGYTILYLNDNENLLRFSNNRLLDNDILDFGILNQQFNLKLEYDETILDVIWAEGSKYLEDIRLGAIICPNKIFFIDQNLCVLESVHINNISLGINPIIAGSFLGFGVVVVNKTNAYYVSLDKKVVPMLSFENIGYKNNVMIALLDRIVVASKKRHDFNPKHKGKQNNLEVFYSISYK